MGIGMLLKDSPIPTHPERTTQSEPAREARLALCVFLQKDNALLGPIPQTQ